MRTNEPYFFSLFYLPTLPPNLRLMRPLSLCTCYTSQRNHMQLCFSFVLFEFEIFSCLTFIFLLVFRWHPFWGFVFFNLQLFLYVLCVFFVSFFLLGGVLMPFVIFKLNIMIFIPPFSGLLTSYLLLRQMSKAKLRINWVLYYFHRYWR